MTPSPRPPRLLVVLAFTGVVLGGAGAYSEWATVRPFLLSRGAYVSAFREQFEPSLHQVAPNEDAQAVCDRLGDALYSRRGVTLTLAAANLILSLLLLAGCLRALRGDAWGASAWELAALTNLPYTVLAMAFVLVQQGDVSDALAGGKSQDLELMVRSGFLVRSFVSLVWSGLELAYFLGCVLYLRQARIRKLFSAPTA